MKQSDLDRLEAVKSYDEWRSTCHAIKAEHGGAYPSDWFETVLKSGMGDRILGRFGLDTKPQVTTVDPDEVEALLTGAKRNREGGVPF